MKQASRTLLVALTVVLTLLPVWGEPSLVTQDGASHVYNAALATWVQASQEPFASSFEVKTGVQPNVATHALLGALGPRVGWERAERLLVTLIVLATLAAVLALARPVSALIPAAAWFASSWFVWMGFYDFALSIPCFIGLLLALPGPSGTRRTVMIQLSFALLYLTHIFTFAVGIGLVATAIAWDARAGRRSRRELWMVAPAAALLLLEMAGGSPAGGAMAWTEGAWSRLLGFASGDFAVTLIGADSIAGMAFVVAAIAAAVAGFRRRADDASPWTGVQVFGFAVIALSLIAPDNMGEGGYIPVRLRLLGTLALLPAMADVARRIRPALLRVIAAVFVCALVTRTGWMLRDADGVHGERLAVDRLLARAGATNGSWLVSRLTAYRRWPFRIGASRHLAESVATLPPLAVLNNYEALNGVFFVRWRARPDWIFFRPVGHMLVARLVPGERAWTGPMYVIHESDWQVAPADSQMNVTGTMADGRLAVTVLQKRQPVN